MENNYNVEEILENPGLYCFKIDNENNSIDFGKKNTNYSEKEVYEIKRNIIEVFKNISLEIKKYENYNPEYMGHIINNLNSAYNNKKKFYFPGLQVINMDREKLEYFTHWPDRFLLCEKSDGVRYLLVQYKNGKCHLIGRNLEFFEVFYSEKLPPSFPGKLNSDWNIEYLLDGELVLDSIDEKNDEKTKFIKVNGEQKKINYLIFDAVVIKGSNIGFLPFKRRLEEFSKIFMREYTITKYIKNRGNLFIDKYKSELEKSDFIKLKKLKKSIESTARNSTDKIITLYIKDYYTFDNVQKLNELIKLLPHHNDGLIINVDDYPYYSGQSCEIFKWKPLEMNTIDFEIEYNEKIKRYVLYITIKEGNLPVEILCFDSDEEKGAFEKDYNRTNNKHIAECFYDSELINDEVAINNFNLLKIKDEKNDDISKLFDSFINKVPSNKEKYKGGWRFQRFRNDKLNSNYINTYQNIKICIKENIQMNEIVKTVEKNKNNRLSELTEEKDYMSALIWKKFFKKKQKDNDEDDLFLDDINDGGNYSIKNELLSKKRKSPEDVKNKDANENDNINENKNEDGNNDDEDNYDDDLDKIYDEDDDYY